MRISKIQTVAAVAALTVSLCAVLPAQDRLTKALDRYEHETDPVRKAKELAKLGPEQVTLAGKKLKSGDDEGSLSVLQQYRDEVQKTFEELKATGIDPVNKSAGFKELQISLRESNRRINDLIFALPVDKRPFFREIRTDLEQVQNDLIDMLFPRGPVKKSKKAKS